MDPNLNALWCRCIAEELHRAGVNRAVLCPGSRNSPLLFALAAELGEEACLGHADERGAAFLALGMARAGGRPAAVCVTSGSALANCLPALCEAKATGLPLVVVAADRPWELHGNGAPQSMPQAATLGAHLAGELALGEPSADDRALRALRARVSRLAQTPGPVLLNVPLRDPLPPLPDPAFAPAGLSEEALRGRRHGAAYTTVGLCAGAAAGLALDELGCRPGLRGVLVAGATPTPFPHPAASALAFATGLPLLADAGSNLRRDGQAGLIACADALLAGPLGQSPPELVVQIGQAPLARRVHEWLDRCRGPWICLEDGGGGQDWLSRAAVALPLADAAAATALAERIGRGDAAWSAAWSAAEARAADRLGRWLGAAAWGADLAAHRALHHPGFAFIGLANSMAVRLANLHLRPDALPRPVLTARGVSGIDGTIAGFAGAARVLGRGLLLCGDLAALHDLPSLDACRDGEGGAIVVLNNRGGAIFDFLPVAEVPGYRRWVRADHRRDLAHAAAQAGLAYHGCADEGSLRAALGRAAAGGWHLVECLLEEGDADRHRALVAGLAAP